MTVLRSAAVLWQPAQEVGLRSGKPVEWPCKSNSAFLSGSVSAYMTHGPSYRCSAVWDIVKWHYGFVGVEWKRASEHPELVARYKPRIWQKGFEAFGENWRGNWIGSAYGTTLTAPPLTLPTQHDKLEAALCVREFLSDKMPTDRLALWIEDALHSP